MNTFNADVEKFRINADACKPFINRLEVGDKITQSPAHNRNKPKSKSIFLFLATVVNLKASYFTQSLAFPFSSWMAVMSALMFLKASDNCFVAPRLLNLKHENS